MQKKYIFLTGRLKYIITTVLFLIGGVLFSSGAYAQIFCSGETVLWAENFGTGSTVSSHPDVINLNYVPTGELDDGQYRIANNTQQRAEWHNSGDHTTSTTNGKMLVVNGSAQTFYSTTITNGGAGFTMGNYAASLFLINVNTPGTCSPDPLLPTITFMVEYNTALSGNSGGWVSLQNVTATSVPQTVNPTWIQLGGIFNLPVPAQRMRLSMSNGTVSGCGNDYAVDDIQFATCPTGGPLPVDFLSIAAIQKGAGVDVQWKTSFETNNKYFNLERSHDGSNWALINAVPSLGNTSSVRSYSAYDAKPISGYNYYRIKQVDFEGRFKYSDIVKVKISIDKISVSVVANPFVNNIIVDFLSNKKQNVTIRIADITGRQMTTEKWQISNGSSRMQVENINTFLPGLYIFSVTDEDGKIIYHNKLMKQ